MSMSVTPQPQLLSKPRYPRLTAEGERECARQVVQRRREYWRFLLSDSPVLDTVLSHLHDRIDDVDARRLVADAMSARSRGRERDDDSNRGPCDNLVETMTWLDAQTRIADGLVDGSIKAPKAWRVAGRAAQARYRAARDRFVVANLGLVAALAGRWGRHHMSLADRIQEGNLGLIRAVDTFDPERGVRFSTYAAWWIRHAIIRALVNHGRLVRIPSYIQATFTKMRGVQRRLLGELGRNPSDERLAREMGVEPEVLQRVRDAMAMRAVPTDAGSWHTGDEDDIADENTHDLGENIDARRNYAITVEAMTGLDDKERDILSHRFGLGGASETSLQNLGDRYALSRERIRQLQNRALEKLRGAIESSPLSSHLFAAA